MSKTYIGRYHCEPQYELLKKCLEAMHNPDDKQRPRNCEVSNSVNNILLACVELIYSDWRVCAFVVCDGKLPQKVMKRRCE